MEFNILMASGQKLSLSLLVLDWMLRYLLLDNSRVTGPWLGSLIILRAFLLLLWVYWSSMVGSLTPVMHSTALTTLWIALQSCSELLPYQAMMAQPGYSWWYTGRSFTVPWSTCWISSVCGGRCAVWLISPQHPFQVLADLYPKVSETDGPLHCHPLYKDGSVCSQFNKRC